MRRSGLSGTAVFRATEDLTEKQLVRIGAPMPDGRGQPSHRIFLNPDALFTLGLSVMNDFAEAAIVDLSGKVRKVVDVSAPGMARGAVLANTIAMLNAAKDTWLPRHALHGAGVAIAGYFIGDGGQMNPAAPLDDWAMRDLHPELAAAFGCPVTIDNIGNAAVIGETLLGVGQQYRNFAYLNFAAGFGGGLVVDGRPWRGAHGNAGEFAGVLLAAGLFVPTLERLRERLVAAGVSCASVTELVSRYDDDWPAIAGWIADAMPSLQALVRIIGAAIDVDAIVLGGRLPPALAARLVAASHVPQTTIDQAARRGRGAPAPVVVAAEISSQASVIGAATLAMPEMTSFRSPD